MGAGGRSAASKRRLRHQQQPLVRTLNMQNKNEMQRGDFLSVWINLLREREMEWKPLKEISAVLY